MANLVRDAWWEMRNYGALSAQELAKESVELAKHSTARQRIADRAGQGQADDMEYALFQEELIGMVIAKFQAETGVLTTP